MSEPIRYEYSNGNNYWGHFINPKTQHFAPYGEYVRYEDYARLKAEVERLQSIDSIGIEQLKAEVERLTADLNKMTKTPEGVDYVEVDVGFWTKSGSRLPSSYRTFWSNDKGVQS